MHVMRAQKHLALPGYEGHDLEHSTGGSVQSLMLDRRPERPELKPETVADLLSYKCISCHTLERVNLYRHSDWQRVVGRMRAYGMRLTDEEMQKVVTYLTDKKANGDISESQVDISPSP